MEESLPLLPNGVGEVFVCVCVCVCVCLCVRACVVRARMRARVCLEKSLVFRACLPACRRGGTSVCFSHQVLMCASQCFCLSEDKRPSFTSTSNT